MDSAAGCGNRTAETLRPPNNSPFGWHLTLGSLLCVSKYIILQNKLNFKIFSSKENKGYGRVSMDKCPICGENTRVKLMPDTELKHFPLFCRKCRAECIINVKQFKIEVLEKRKLEK